MSAADQPDTGPSGAESGDYPFPAGMMEFPKGQERYLYFFDGHRKSRSELFKVFARQASHADLSLSLQDLAALVTKYRQTFESKDQ